MKYSKYHILIFVLFLVLSSFPTIQNAFGQSNAFINVLVSTSDVKWPDHVEPTLAFGNNGTIYAGWKNANSFYGSGQSVSFSYSTDGGISWSKPVDMPSPFKNFQESDPWMQFFNGTLYYSYLDYNATLNLSQVVMASTSDNGKNWNVVTATSGNGFADKETFTIDKNGIIYIAYDSVQLSGEINLRLSRSFDGGNTFVDNVTIPEHTYGYYVGAYIIPGNDNGTLYTAYDQLGIDPSHSDVIFSKSTDFGNTWDKGLSINSPNNGTWTTAIFGNYAGILTLAAMKQDSTGRIYIVWNDVSDNLPNIYFNVYMRYSDDGGKTWSNKITISDSTNNNQWEPCLAIGSNNIVHLAYYDNSSSGGYNVKYRTFDPNTSKLSKEITVTSVPTPGQFTRPGDYMTIKLNDQNIPSIIWSDGRSQTAMDIYFGTFLPKITSTSSKKSFFPFYSFLVFFVAFEVIRKKKLEITK